MSEQLTKKINGKIAGIIACILAILGILTIGAFFIPIAVIFAIYGTIVAIKSKNLIGIGINALAWVLIVVGVFTSPLLIGIVAAMLTAIGL